MEVDLEAENDFLNEMKTRHLKETVLQKGLIVDWKDLTNLRKQLD